MAELILNNLPIVLFIVITIVVRALQTRAKAAARRTGAPEEFASALEPDDEAEDYAGPDEPEEAYTAAPVKKAEFSRPPEEENRFDSIPGLFDEKPQGPDLAAGPGPAGLAARKPTPAAAPERREKGGGFFPPLERFTPPQRAVVWAEILGKPKGME
jgi:hypothetical protein